MTEPGNNSTVPPGPNSEGNAGNGKDATRPVLVVSDKIPKIPTQEAIDGIRFDFNDGLRLWLPKDAKSYRVRFVDLDNKFTLLDIVTQAATPDSLEPSWIISTRKYFIRLRLILSDPKDDRLLFSHDFDARDKDVVVRAFSPAIGDTIAWFSNVEKFQLKHQCRLHCVVSEWFVELVKNQYPNIHFISEEQQKEIPAYATYVIALFDAENANNQPVDHRYVGLHTTGAYILGVPTNEVPPRFDLSAPRQIPEKYACIGVQASSLAKMWNNPVGWRDVVRFLKEQGYRVLCIDKENYTGLPGSFTYMPAETEDFTGAKPLQERINLIKDADFFIGLSSGLSWLAWGCKVPVVLISGFTEPWNEFHTPYRIINRNVCHGCWNDLKPFKLENYWNCPRHQNEPLQFECTAQISSHHVIDVLKKVIEDKNQPIHQQYELVDM